MKHPHSESLTSLKYEDIISSKNEIEILYNDSMKDFNQMSTLNKMFSFSKKSDLMAYVQGVLNEQDNNKTKIFFDNLETLLKKSDIVNKIINSFDALEFRRSIFFIEYTFY